VMQAAQKPRGFIDLSPKGKGRGRKGKTPAGGAIVEEESQDVDNDKNGEEKALHSDKSLKEDKVALLVCACDQHRLLIQLLRASMPFVCPSSPSLNIVQGKKAQDERQLKKEKDTKEKEEKKRLKKEKDAKEREEKKRLQAEEDEKRKSVLLQAAARLKQQQEEEKRKQEEKEAEIERAEQKREEDRLRRQKEKEEKEKLDKAADKERRQQVA
jgi:hypothetical protein